MKSNIYVRKTQLTQQQKDMIVKKIDKLGKFFDDDVTADIVVGYQRDEKIVEVTIRTPQMIYRAEERNEDALCATDEIVDSIVRQIRKNKTRLAKRLRAGVDKSFDFGTLDEGESEINIVKTKKHSIKPMDAEEAVLQMKMLGHSFFVFLDSSTNHTSIVYRRKDGNYGLIETE